MNDLQAGGGGGGEPGEPGGATSAASIVAAAERLAAEITRNARAEADAIRARAGSDSDTARSATKERLRRLSGLADGMLERLGEMRVELDALSGSLDRASPDGQAPAPSASDPVPEGAPPAAAAPVTDPTPAATAAAAVAPDPLVDGVDDAGARLIALNLALSDTSRDEAARQLRDQVPDAERLVAEVYESVDR